MVTSVYSTLADARELDVPFRSIVPSSWTLLPPVPDSYGRRFVSPSGDAWLWYFAVPVNREAAAKANIEQGQPRPMEQVTYEARGGDWIVTSGYRGNRIFLSRN
jgi:hypothetical protein